MPQRDLNIDSRYIEDLHRMNPWWRGNAMEQLPATRRHLVGQIKRRLEYRLAPVVVVRGTRQIGKTTAYLHLIKDFLENGIEPERIFRIQFDDIQAFHLSKEPILQLVSWYETAILKTTLNNKATEGKNCFLFLDEVQNLDNWSAQLKFLVDTSSIQVVVTGRSALRIELGRDSLAGRIITIEAGTLSLTEIGSLRKMNPPPPWLPDNGISILRDKNFWLGLKDYGTKHKAFKDKAFHYFSERGAYPVAHLNPDIPRELVADQLNETVIKRVIQHDLRLGEKGRKRDTLLLEALFRFCCRYAGQAPGLTFLTKEIKTALDANVGQQRINTYLRFRGDTLLLRLLQPLEIRLKKKKSDSKICLADHGLRASWLQENIPLDLDPGENREDIFVMAGFLAESIAGTLFSGISGLDFAFLQARNNEPEIDFVLITGDQRLPVEIKYRSKIKNEHLKGLQWFMDNPVNRAPFGILITKNDEEVVHDDRIIPISLSSLLLLR